MAARKKATKKSSRTVPKKGKPAARSSATRKRKPAAASRPSRSAAKSKAARSAKAKSVKTASARRAAGSAKTTKAPKSATTTSRTTRASAPSASIRAAKPGKPVDTKLQASDNQASETVKTKAASESEPKTSEAKTSELKPGRDTAPPTSAKASAAPLAKRAPIPPKAATKPAAPSEAVAERDEEAQASKAAKPASPRHGFKLNEFVVYPSHGVGQIVAVEEQEVAGFRLELFVINFAKDKMTLRVPTSKVTGVGMRKLSEPDVAKRSLDILTGRARVKRTMWSRRAQEYEAKINSGDINAIAEVVRDLYRSDAQPEQSYSERQLYEAALDRMMREIAAVQKLTEMEALKVIEGQLKKSQRRAAKGDAGEGDDGAIEEAA